MDASNRWQDRICSCIPKKQASEVPEHFVLAYEKRAIVLLPQDGAIVPFLLIWPARMKLHFAFLRSDTTLDGTASVFKAKSLGENKTRCIM